MALSENEIKSIIEQTCNRKPERVDIIGGGVNTVAKIVFPTKTVIFKAKTFSHLSNEQFFVQYYLQEMVHKQINLSPKPLGLYPSPKNLSVPFMLMEYKPSASPPPSSEPIAREMGRLLGKLHSEFEYETTGEFTVDSLSNPKELKIEERNWENFATMRLKTIANQCPVDTLTNETKQITDALTEHTFTISGFPTIGHMDFRPDNVIWDESENSFTGTHIIDWDEVYIIDSAYSQVLSEFFLTHMIPDDATRTRITEGFREGYRKTGNYFITPELNPQEYAVYYLFALLRKIRGIHRWSFREQSEKEVKLQKNLIQKDFSNFISYLE